MGASGRVGYAVVGLGHFAEHVVLPGFRHSRKAQLVALVSGDERKARRLAKKFGASDIYQYDGYAQCLNHPQVNAVYIATNNSTHAEFTVRAAAAGKHVLCEKPMATSVAECQQMIDACRSNHVRLMIAYRKYFEPGALHLKSLVKNGKFGRLKILHSTFTIYGPRTIGFVAGVLSSSTALFWGWANWKGKLPEPPPLAVEPEEVEVHGEPTV